MIASLERAGYRAGHNLYGVPFDWRYDPTENHLCGDLAHMLHHVSNTTRWSKAYVVAHSLGNVQILYCMQRVFGVETTSKIRSLVSIAAPYRRAGSLNLACPLPLTIHQRLLTFAVASHAPRSWTGSPKALRVLFSGDEMVSQYIISDADTRDFARQMSAAYMLLPDERVWGNHTVLSLVGGDAQLGVTTLPRYGGVSTSTLTGGSVGSAEGSDGTASTLNQYLAGAENYRATRADLRALFSKVGAHAATADAGRMRAAYDASLRLVDVWRAPPVPVVCVIAAGQPTNVGYLYREPWPRNMLETPCPLKYEDGDQTVPVRSVESVCRHWQQQKRCHSPLSTAQPTLYKGKTDECVEVVYMHCRSANMESADAPRGTEQCAELHSKILGKQPVIDLVQSLSLNPRTRCAASRPNLTTHL